MVSTAKIGNDKKKQIWAGDQIEAVEKIPWRNKKQRTLLYTYPDTAVYPRSPHAHSPPFPSLSPHPLPPIRPYSPP